MADAGKDSGRNVPSKNKQEFMKEIYRKEEHRRLGGYLMNAKYRERQKTGEFKMITVLRDKYLAGVPKAGGYYKRVRPSSTFSTVECMSCGLLRSMIL